MFLGISSLQIYAPRRRGFSRETLVNFDGDPIHGDEHRRMIVGVSRKFRIVNRPRGYKEAMYTQSRDHVRKCCS